MLLSGGQESRKSGINVYKEALNTEIPIADINTSNTEALYEGQSCQEVTGEERLKIVFMCSKNVILPIKHLLNF